MLVGFLGPKIATMPWLRRRQVWRDVGKGSSSGTSLITKDVRKKSSSWMFVLTVLTA